MSNHARSFASLPSKTLNESKVLINLCWSDYFLSK